MRPEVITPAPRRSDKMSPKRRPNDPTTTCSRRSVVVCESKKRLVDNAPTDAPASHAERALFASPPSQPAGPTGGLRPQAPAFVAHSRPTRETMKYGTSREAFMNPPHRDVTSDVGVALTRCRVASSPLYIGVDAA